MFEKLKEILTGTRVVIKSTPKVIASSINEEIAEIKDLNLTEVDNVQGEVVASVAIAAMNSLGIPCSMAMKEIIKTSAAYAIRDFKEGSTNPEKLIVARVINKYKEKLAAKNMGIID